MEVFMTQCYLAYRKRLRLRLSFLFALSIKILVSTEYSENE